MRKISVFYVGDEWTDYMPSWQVSENVVMHLTNEGPMFLLYDETITGDVVQRDDAVNAFGLNCNGSALSAYDGAQVAGMSVGELAEILLKSEMGRFK